MIDKYQGLKLVDSILMMLLNSAATAVGGNPLPYKNLAMSAGLGLQENTLVKISDIAEAEDGQEIYKKWEVLTETTQKQAAYCHALYQEAYNRMVDLEKRIGACYAKKDALTDDYNKMKAKKEGGSKQIELLRKSIDEKNRDVASLQERIRKLEKDKKTYDILRWIPVVNLVSEIVAAIDGTRNKLQATQRELNQLSAQLRSLYDEQGRVQSEMAVTEQKLHEIDIETARLEEERELCQKHRDDASHEMIDWKDRERYCLRIKSELEHLLALEADVKEFQKLLADNPPPFQIAA